MRLGKWFIVAAQAALLTAFCAGCAGNKAVKRPDNAADTSATAAQKPQEIKEVVAADEKSNGAMSSWENSQADTAIFKDVHFDFNLYNLLSGDIQTLGRIIGWMNDNPGVTVRVEGHCDERGSGEYNLALGEKRADAVRDYLVKGGIDKKRIAIISYGEERPLDPAHTEDAYVKNRRAHFEVKK